MIQMYYYECDGVNETEGFQPETVLDLSGEAQAAARGWNGPEQRCLRLGTNL